MRITIELYPPRVKSQIQGYQNTAVYKSDIQQNIDTLNRAIERAPEEDKQGLCDTLSILSYIQNCCYNG